MVVVNKLIKGVITAPAEAIVIKTTKPAEEKKTEAKNKKSDK